MADEITTAGQGDGSQDYQMNRKIGTIFMLISATGMGLVPLFSRWGTRTDMFDATQGLNGSDSIGAIMANFYNDCDGLLASTDEWTPALFMLFFVISGAELDLAALPTVGVLGLIYIVVRALGKYFGARFSAKAVGCPDTVVKFLGVTLFPQEGVALGMTATALSLGSDGTYIRNIVLFAVLIGLVCALVQYYKIPVLKQITAEFLLPGKG